ncbi:CRISPR-associated helicase Cas3' [Gemmata sp. JC673]|uniref:CRISPR-associated helicase Cas3 n=1 Tax=Gemmata algarum TaxID=2975278 RepID=A0ABU5F3Q0_9BACT|nr:CRISPR-associated helicase Cas3' [Gemmata algarum]MDY3562203.1 CRISPR-associated helicase Cas3' [Gemmata algarum]
MSELLAKSPRGNTRITLLEHTRDVMNAAEALFGNAQSPTRLGTCWLRFFRIPEMSWTKFHGNLLAACGLHDWGKANDGFQKAVRFQGPQAIRHEHFSALLVAQKACWDWLGQRPDLDREVILSAVLTHHLKAREDADAAHGFATAVENGSRFQSLHTDTSFPPIVAEIAGRVGLPSELDLLKVPTAWAFAPRGGIDTERKRIKGALKLFWRVVDGDNVRRRFLHAVRAALIASDAAGSGIRRIGQDIPQWVAGTFDTVREWTDADVRSNVIGPRTEQVAKGGTFKWNDFQEHCADPKRVPSRALLLAPCGSGKTLAAWRWIEEQAKRRVGHVLFLYPTRATATEGFRDYVSWAPEADAALMHGTSEFDLNGMFENPPEGDARKGRTFAQTEAERRLFSLGFWGRRAFSATVDQFLAFLQYGYGPMCMLPVLADSVVVIDEVHSFDKNMFAALKKFLTEFDVPVLCMTATLPNDRRAELVNECGLKVYPDGELPPDLKEVAERKRYRLRRLESRDEAEKAVRTALADGKRVLWVVNQVKRAHAVVARFVKELPADSEDTKLATADTPPVPVYCYHSRFKLTDRVNRHTALMAALKADKPGPALGVTTQVCEMSLDIDVDLLVTEDCPVTALVQRMGRCNRAQKPRALGSAGDVLVYKPEEDAPYDANSLTGLAEFLDAVKGRELSQDDLEKALREAPSPASLGDPLCSFLESGPYAVAGEEQFRDSEEFNRPCVLPGDVTAYLSAGTRQPGFVLPVPKKFARERDPDNPDHAELSGHLGVARGGQYHAAVGYCDNSLTEWRGV